MEVTRASLRLFRRSSCIGYSASRSCLSTWRRNYSTEGLSSEKFEAIRQEMLNRPTQWTRDIMSATNSVLLNVALADFVPPEAGSSNLNIKSTTTRKDLPRGHHLVYFPLQKTESKLCPDGTDPFHSPGEPFVRRMWAGGSVEFNGKFFVNSSSVDCEETIEDVTVKGPEGEEKIFVTVLRKYIMSADRMTIKDGARPPPRIQERRNLVFMRGLSKEQARENLERSEEAKERIVKAPNEPDYSFTLTPTSKLLFNYSALSFNAHSIHLDREYCREVEGHRNLLVHGPLSLTLMLSALNSQLNEPQEDDTNANELQKENTKPHKPKEEIIQIDYRNIAPLYADEPLRVCVRLAEDGFPETRNWEVWVEDRDGGLAVRGTATTQKLLFRKEQNSESKKKGTQRRR